MKILLLGGTGFIGPHVVRHLVSAGHEAAVLSRGKRRVDLPSGVLTVVGDYHNLPELPSELRGIFAGAPPDVVLDMIPMTERDARNALDVFSGFARRIVAASSGDVYRAWGYGFGLEAQPCDPRITEDSPLRESRFPYRGRGIPIAVDWELEDYDKILVERVFQSDPALPATILRLPMIYGPGDYAHRAFPYLKRMDDGRRVIPIEEAALRWRGPWGYVEDVAAAIALAVTNDTAAGRVYNVAESDHRSVAEFIAGIAEAVGWTGRVVGLPPGTLAGLWNAYKVEQQLLIDSSRIRLELGYRETTPRAEAMRRTIAWERANPPDPISARMFDYAAEDRALAQYQSATSP